MKECIEGLKIDWVKSYSDLPDKAAITDKNGELVKTIPYELGIQIEEKTGVSLDELDVSAFVEEQGNELYIEYSVSKKDGDQVYAIASNRVPISK